MSMQLRANMKVILTRSSEGNELLASKLRENGITPIKFNTLTFSPPRDWSRVDECIRNLVGFDWLVFTSPTGVKYFAERMRKLGFEIPQERPRVAAVGAMTAEALRERKFRIDFVPGEYLTTALGDGLPEGGGRRVLLMRARIASRELAKRLARRGFKVTEAAIYETSYGNGDGTLEELRRADLIAFASPSAVRGFCLSVPRATLRRIRDRTPALCIGPVTSKVAEQQGFKTLKFPKTHTIDGLVGEIRRLKSNA